jgi:hypothetical protein
VSIRCHVARAGNTFAELEAELKEVIPSDKRPALLERFIGAERPHVLELQEVSEVSDIF